MQYSGGQAKSTFALFFRKNVQVTEYSYIVKRSGSELIL